MIELKHLHHISLVTQNVPASRRFYCDILGMADVPRPANFTFEGAWFRHGVYEIHLIGWADATQYIGLTAGTINAYSDRLDQATAVLKR